MVDPVYIGLLVTSQVIGQSTVGYFTDVELTPEVVRSSVEEWQLYR